MQIELVQGRVTNITPLEKPQGVVDCHLGDHKLRLNRDLADKVVDGDGVMIAGYLHEGQLTALALNNLSQHKMAQVDGSNYVFAMGIAGFLAILCAVQGINLFGAGDVTIAYLLGIVSSAGFVGIFVALQRIVDINRALRRIKHSS